MPVSMSPEPLDSFISPVLPSVPGELDFEQEIERIQTYRKNLIARRNQLFSPIARLPDATLAMIFRFVESSESFGWIDRNDGWEDTDAFLIPNPRQLIPTLLVSRQWRDIALAEPTLWCFLDTTVWSPDGLLSLVERSKGCHLSCVIREQYPGFLSHGHLFHLQAARKRKEWGFDELRSILSLSSRMQRVDLVLKASRFRLFALDRTSSWDELEHASFTAMSSDSALEPDLPITAARKLRSLSLYGIKLGLYTYSCPALRSFSLKNSDRSVMTTSLEELLMFLEQTPLLEHLMVEASQSDVLTTVAETDTKKTVTLPRLTRLSLELYRSGRSPLLSLLKHLVAPNRYSSRLYLLLGHNPHLWDGTSVARESQLLDIAETLSLSLPHEVAAAIRPCQITITLNQPNYGMGVLLKADMMSDKTPAVMASLQVEVSGFSDSYDSWSSEPDEGTQNSSVERVVHQSRCVEVLLPRMCSTSSLVTLDCSIEILSSLWISAFGHLKTLSHIRLHGESTVSRFADALAPGDWGGELDCPFPVLRHLEMYWSASVLRYHHSIREDGAWGRPPDASRVEGDSTLSNVATRLEERFVYLGSTPLAHLTIHREAFSFCMGLDPSELFDMGVLGRISEVVEELLLVP